MKSPRALAPASGINVMAADTALKADEVRDAVNVVLRADGGFARRDGFTKAIDLVNARALWQADGGRVFVADDASLYEVTRDLQLVEIYDDVWSGPVTYADTAGLTYASAGALLRITATGVELAGVMSLLGFKPTLSLTVGGLEAGDYGVAVSAVSATGEESGLSDMGRITLVAPSAIVLTLPDAPAHVTRWNLYRTTPNGGLLYKAGVAAAGDAAATLNFGELGRDEASNWMREPLPCGDHLSAHAGRLFSAVGCFLFHSDPFSALMDSRHGFTPFGERITMLLSVAGGHYVGTESCTYFIAGTNPKEYSLRRVDDSPPIEGSGRLVAGDFFGRDADKVAVWLTELGYLIGSPDGQVAAPQSTRIRITSATRATTTPVVLKGVKQLVSAVDALVLGGEGAAHTTP